MPEAKLYELTEELDAVLAQLEAQDGELTPELERWLDEAQGRFDEKVEKTALAIRTLEARADMVRSEIDRLETLRKPLAKSAESLKRYLHTQMETAGVRKVDGELAKVWVQKNSRPSIRYDGNLDDLPESLRRVETSFDSQAAYGLWKSSEPLPDGIVIDHGTHLRIK